MMTTSWSHYILVLCIRQRGAGFRFALLPFCDSTSTAGIHQRRSPDGPFQVPPANIQKSAKPSCEQSNIIDRDKNGCYHAKLDGKKQSNKVCNHQAKARDAMQTSHAGCHAVCVYHIPKVPTGSQSKCFTRECTDGVDPI